MPTIGLGLGLDKVLLGSKVNPFDLATLKICLTGDSIARGVDSTGNNYSVAELIANEVGCEQVTIAFPADNTAQQLVRWDALSNEEKQSFDYIINCNGNNIAANPATAHKTSVDLYQTLMNNLIADKKESCKIICCTMTPSQSYHEAIYAGTFTSEQVLAKRQSMNEAIAGLGVYPVTGQDLLVLSYTDLLSDGNYSLKEEYYANGSDSLHVNEAGRQVMADEIIKIIVADKQNSISGNVSNLAIEILPKSNKLTWDNSAINNFDGIKIERSLNGVDFTEIKSLLNVSYYEDDNIDFDTLYFYKIRGFKGNKYTAYTAIVNGTSYAFLSYLADGNTFGLYNPFDLTTITKNESNIVSAATDKLGSGNDFVSGSCLLAADGLLFNGDNQYLKTAAKTLNLPVSRYLILKQKSWTLYDRVMDGFTDGTLVIRQDVSSPKINVLNISGYGGELSLPIDEYGLIKTREVGSGATNQSSMQLNNEDIIYFTSSNGNPGGLTIGSRGAASASFGNVVIAGLIVRKVLDDDKTFQKIGKSLKLLCGI